MSRGRSVQLWGAKTPADLSNSACGALRPRLHLPGCARRAAPDIFLPFISEALLKHHPRPNTRSAEAPMIVQFLDPSCPFSPLVFKPITWRYMCAHCTRTPATRPAWIERHMRIVGCVAAFFGSHQSQRSWPGACVEHSGSCKNSVCCALTENTRPPLNPPAGKVGAQPLNR